VLHHDHGRSDEAGTEYSAALAIAREVGDRRGEGIALSKLGGLHAQGQRPLEAGRLYEEALVLARERGDRRIEGVALSGLADLRLRTGCVGEAIEILRGAEALLRELSDRQALAPLLCIRGRAEAAIGERAAAGATLAEVESIAAAMGSTPDTELGRQLAALRAALAWD